MISNSGTSTLGLYDLKRQIDAFGGVDYFRTNLAGGYLKNARVMLANGDIVKSLVNGNTINPNNDMTGWVNPIKYIKTQVSFYATPENFGAKVNDPSFDSYEYLQAWLYSGLSLRIGRGTYYTSKPLIVLPSTQILGAGLRTSNIQKTTNDTISFEYFTPTGDLVIEDIDAVFILKQDNVTRYSDRLDMRGFTLAKTWGLDNSTKENPSFGIFAPYVSESSFQNISVLDVYHPIYAINVWMVTMLRVQGHGPGGWVLGGSDGDALRGGTSITALSCWSTAVRGDNFSYNLNNLHYSSFTNCGSDSVGLDGQPAGGIWNIKDCTIGIRNTACEVVHAYKYLKCSNSNIEFSGITFEAFFNKYGGVSNHLFQLDAYSTVSIKNSKLLFVYNVGEVPNVSNFAIANEFSEFYLSESEIYPRVSGVSNGTSFEVAIGAQSYAKIEGKGGSIELSSGDNTWIPSANNSHYTSSNTLITGAYKGYFGASSPLAGQWHTNIFRIGAVRIWFSPTKETLLYKLYSDPESDLDGIEFATRSDGMRGTTAQRPSSSWRFIGFYFFDTTINKPVWWNGLNWTDSAGAVV